MIGKDGKNGKTKTKKKRNFIEDLPMDLHIDDSDDGQLQNDGEESKQPEPVFQPSNSIAKQASTDHKYHGKLLTTQTCFDIPNCNIDGQDFNLKPEVACNPSLNFDPSHILPNGIDMQVASKTATDNSINRL